MSTFSSSPQPLYIRGHTDPIFALFHEPHGSASDIAVLLCPPFGWEDMCSYRSRLEWAVSLAAAGFPTLRIDLPGSGDSAGGPRDPERLEAWTDAIEVSSRWLSHETGARRIVAIGIGLGGVLVYRATVLGAPIDDLVLWGVRARGRRHVRELKAFSYLEVHRDDDKGVSAPVTSEDPDGSLVVAGYVLSAATQRELDGLDLAELDPSRLSSSRVLMLERDGRAVDTELRKAIEHSGARLTVAPGDGYAAMMMVELPHAQPAYTVFDTVSSWLSAASPDGGGNSMRPAGQASLNGTLTSAPELAASDSVEISMPDGERVRETPIAICDPFGDLLGVLTEPLTPAAGLCAVWLNAGPQRRTGPNRMWVETARRWAARGVPTFRVDLAGIGDAQGDSDSLLDVRSYFVADYLKQVRLVLDTLQARGLPPRFLLGGLCAGGYWALQAAQDDSRVSAAAALNPAYLVYDGGRSRAANQLRALGPRMLKRSTWGRILRGQITPSVHLSAIRTLIGTFGRAVLDLPSRIARHRESGAAGGNDVELAFDRLREENRRALILFAGDEELYIRLMRTGRLKDLSRWPNISLQHLAVSGNMHTLRPLALQRQAHQLVDELLQAELELIESDSPASRQAIVRGL